MVNRIWPTAVAVKADNVSSVSASACHIGGPNSVNPGQILSVYGIMNIVLMLYHLTLSTSHIGESGLKKMHVLLITLTFITQIMAALCPTSRGLLR